MLISLILTYQFIFCVKCDVWTLYDYPRDYSSLEPYLSNCALKAYGVAYRAFRLKISDFSCEPVPVISERSVRNDSNEEFIYVTKKEVKITEFLKQLPDRRQYADINPITLHPGSEISLSFTPGLGVPILTMALRHNIDIGMNLMIDVDASIKFGSGRNVNALNPAAPGFTFAYIPGQMSILTLRCTTTAFEILVDGKLRYTFKHRIEPHLLTKILIKVEDQATRFHYLRYSAA